MQVQLIAELPTDSKDYDVLAEGIQLSTKNNGIVCEIGLRRGGGTKHIIDALKKTGQKKICIAIDPYGDIPYKEDEKFIKCDYTNNMYLDCMLEIFLYCKQNNQDFLFFKLEDTEFFEKYKDGIPIYDNNKKIINSYSFIHFDGPHAVDTLISEIDFFNLRCGENSVWVFDDVELYDHNKIHTYIKTLGWNIVRTTERKWMYQK